MSDDRVLVECPKCSRRSWLQPPVVGTWFHLTPKEGVVCVTNAPTERIVT